jgi:hypothetical protein
MVWSTIALIFCATVQAQSTPSDVGQWSPVYAWPDVGIHLHYLPTGKILSFSDDDDPDFYTKGTRRAGFTKTYIVEMPNMQAPGAVTYLPNNTTNLFCSGHSFLPNGQLIVMGGHHVTDEFGSLDVNILDYGPKSIDPSKYRWQLQGTTPMKGGRWYASASTLPSGEVVVVGGVRNGVNDPNTLPQVWQTLPGGGWRDLTGAQSLVNLYSPMHVAPNGKVFMSGTAQLTRYLDTSGPGTWSDLGNRLYGMRDYGSAVMYEPGKVLITGGGDPPTATAETIDLNASSPAWSWTGSMHFPRRHVNATILPDGKVLATGGTSSGGFNDATNAVLAAEIWDPSTGIWTQVARMQISRVYHSTAVLLPDARVLIAGGGRPAPIAGVDNYNAEIYSPPYLFKGPRPQIKSAPKQVRYGQVFSVQTPDAGSIADVTWVKLSSVTHTFNMNQRFNRLSFSRTANGLNITPPSDRRVATPGHYMLFLLNSNGVPSIAPIVAIN